MGLSGGDGAEVEFAAGQVDHGAEVAHVLESAGSGLDVLDDAVESFEDRVGVGVVEVGEDVPPVAAYLAGELFHGFESGARHPRAQTLEGRLGLGSIGAGVVDVLEGLAHLTGASGFQSSPLQAALGFQLQAGQVRFVPQPQVLGPLEQRVAAGLLFADLVDGLVGVFDHVELVDGGVVTFCWTPVSLFFDYAMSPSSRLRLAMLVPKVSLILSSRYQVMYPSSRSMNPLMVTPAKSRPWKNSCLRRPKNPSAAALSGEQPFALIDRVSLCSPQMRIHPGHR